MVDHYYLIRLDDLQVRLLAIRPFNDKRIDLRRIADAKMLDWGVLRNKEV